jgi:hypothetical protein
MSDVISPEPSNILIGTYLFNSASLGAVTAALG